ncbi:phenazine biosynthesis protein [Kitasatospora sp. NPDC054939]
MSPLPLTRPAEPFSDEHVRAAVAWHFEPATASPFWLAQLPRLGFDPLADVRTAADLARFPDLSDELRSVPAADLVPRGLAKDAGQGTYRVYESGGTSGAPKRIVDGGSRLRTIRWAERRLRAQGVPESDWAHLGPTGPHVFGWDCAQYAELGGGFFHTVDFDPRWVKKLIAAGRGEVAAEYVQHLLDQLQEILRSQPVGVLSTTPPLIEAIAARPELYELVVERVRAIVWAGTSFSPESLRQVEEHLFPGTALVGIYGNTLMGVAPQRPRREGDRHGCVFEPHPDTVRIDLLGADGEPVAYGERGRVRLHVVTEEMFLPNILERDTAIRVEPVPGGTVDGLAEVGTLGSLDDVKVIEGVY